MTLLILGRQEPLFGFEKAEIDLLLIVKLTYLFLSIDKNHLLQPCQSFNYPLKTCSIRFGKLLISEFYSLYMCSMIIFWTLTAIFSQSYFHIFGPAQGKPYSKDFLSSFPISMWVLFSWLFSRFPTCMFWYFKTNCTTYLLWASHHLICRYLFFLANPFIIRLLFLSAASVWRFFCKLWFDFALWRTVHTALVSFVNG